MPRAKIAYDFSPVPKKRDPRWRNLRNTIGQILYGELFMLTDGKPYAFAGEWDVFVCRELHIPGPQRTNFCRALREMEAVGLITASATHIDIVFMEQVASRSGPLAEQVPTTRRAASVQVESSLEPSNENHSTHVSQTDKTEETEEKENAGAPAHAHTREAEPPAEGRAEPGDCAPLQGFRRPLGEAPPSVWMAQAEPESAPERPLSELVIGEYRKRHLAKRGTWPSETKWHRQHAADLAGWCERAENQAAYKLAPLPLAAAVLDGLFANAKAEREGFKLSWAVNDPEQYLRDSKPAARLEMHEEWKPMERVIPIVKAKPLTAAELEERERERKVIAELRAEAAEIWGAAQ